MTSRHVAAGDHGPPADPSAELSPSQETLAQLQRKIESLPTIEQAKGILMARFSLDADTAFALLVRWSQVNNLKLRTVSASLVEAATTAGALEELIDRLQRRTATAATPVGEVR
jgi:hypothetical protein